MFKRSLSSVHPQYHLFARQPRLQHAAFLSNIPSFASTRHTEVKKPATPKPPSPSKPLPRQVLKYSFAAFALLAASIASAYELTHLYTEYVAMSPESDEEVKKWGWDFATYWNGDTSRGGTDPQLSHRVRHLIHAAWSASEWDFGPNANIQSTSASDSAQPRFKVLDARLLTTEKYLRAAIEFTEAKNTTSDSDSSTLAQLYLQHALILEQMEPCFWNEAKQQFHKAWKHLPDASHRGFLAWKLGDINERLGLDAEAQEWWDKAINIVQERHPNHSPPTIAVPQSPLLQRILFSTLISKSAYLARHNQLKEARHLEESALDLLRSIHPPDSLASSTPPQALHALYLLQRSSLFSIHLAEVLHAQKRKWSLSAQYLQSAAESSGRVARMLTDGQAAEAIQTSTGIPSSHKKLVSVYDSSRSMNKPAHVLLRDARRTAAEAWNLLGVLYENHQGNKSLRALECFQQAMAWAGCTNPDGTQQVADSTLEADWRIYKGNYERLNSQISAK
ncbi:hypothetical protein CVT24_008195 [Panaeolus cyanescens]|uniref:Uncharacterized protein n=1 Tax=Panaeolus cyanescens TaxID=181874 RepID=A0A409W0F9_9AGAR|nr:hypothetical protein CVT24_008195 [Panaeolus cyanescens]